MCRFSMCVLNKWLYGNSVIDTIVLCIGLVNGHSACQLWYVSNDSSCVVYCISYNIIVLRSAYAIISATHLNVSMLCYSLLIIGVRVVTDFIECRCVYIVMVICLKYSMVSNIR